MQLSNLMRWMIAVLALCCASSSLAAADEAAEPIGAVTADELPPGTPREAIRYATRSFDQWRETLAADLDRQTRLTAVDAMVAFGKRGYENEAVAALAAVLDSKDAKLGHKAAKALGQFGAAAVPPLTAHLQNVNARSRFAAAEALANIGSAAKPATAVLIEALQNGDQSCRRYAAEALGRIGAADEPVVSALVTGLNDEFFQTQREALGSLIRLRAAGENARAAIRKKSLGNLGYLNSVIAEVAAEPQTQVDAEFVLPLLVDMLGHLQEPGGTGSSSNAAVFAALVKLGPQAAPAVAPLLDVLKRRAPQLGGVRGMAAEALGSIGPASAPAVPVLSELLSASLKPSDRRRGGFPGQSQLNAKELRQVVVALGNIGPAATEALPALKELLSLQEAAAGNPLDLRSYDAYQQRERPTLEQIKAAIKQIEG